MKRFTLLSLLGVLMVCTNAYAQTATGPKVLIVNAHPDDETGVAAIVYKITHELNGTVDQCVITNGEGGYKYSTLAEAYYNLNLTDPAVGRANLPRIRKQELMNADKIIGINNIYFLDQKDAHYGLDEKEPLDTTWNVAWVSTRLTEILSKTKYDFIFCMVPVPGTHAHHKAATLLALRAVSALPVAQRPVILGFNVSQKNDTTKLHFTQLKNYTETKLMSDTPIIKFDVTTPFGYNNMLNYKIVVNWEVAEHKSQGVMQMYMGHGDYEELWYFAINGTAGIEKCKALNAQLKNTPYKAKQYKY